MEGMKYTRGSLIILTRIVNGLYRVEMEYLTLRHLIWIIDDNLRLELGNANDVRRVRTELQAANCLESWYNSAQMAHS